MIDPGSPTWLTLRRRIDERIEKLRDELETPGIEPETFRGQIAALRWLKNEVEPSKPITEPTSVDYMQAYAPDPS